jgi:hypothetical protein
MKRLEDSRIWLAAGVLIAVVIGAISWFVVVGPELSTASDLRTQAAETRLQNEALQSTTLTLKAKSTRLVEYTSSLEAALAALPYDSGLPALTRQLNAQARAHDVVVTSVVVGGVTEIEAATPAPAADEAAGTTPDAEPPAVTAAGGLFALQVTVQAEGSLRDQLAFLRTVRADGPRRTLVTDVQVSPGTGSQRTSVDRKATLALEMKAFSAPKTPTQVDELKKLLRGDLRR